MKRLKQLLTSILIVLAILLSSVKLESAEPQSHRANHHETGTAPKSESENQREPQIPLAVWQRTEAALSESISADKERAIADQKRAEGGKQTFCSPAVVVNEALVIIGVGYWIIMWLQWSAIKGQIGATQSQIRAQMDAERPWIMLQKRELKDWKPDGDFPPRITFQIFNYGKGICFMEKTTLRLALYPGDPYNPRLPPQPDYSDSLCSTQKWTSIAIRSGRFRPSFGVFKGACDQATFDQVRHFHSTLVFYGMIEYRDAFKRKHKHGFCSVYLPAGAYGNDPIWNDVGGPDSYRYETTEQTSSGVAAARPRG